MKILNTVQKLWAYCLFCPICQDMTREVHVSVGPDEVFKLLRSKKDNHIIHLNCSAQIKKQKYKANFCINGLDNTFTFVISDLPGSGFYSSPLSVEKAKTPYFYFYVQSNCKRCHCTSVFSSDLELDLLRKVITNIGVERETVILLNESDKYHLSLEYDENQMIISRYTEEDEDLDEEGSLDKEFITSLIDLDFSQPSKVVRKIKT